MIQELIKVDELNNEIGIISKEDAHKQGILHRAFSIFIFNTKGEWLLQRRALSKYHSAGLWTNTCCGHPEKGEMIDESVAKRLIFEMGINCDLKNVFNFTYKAGLENGLIEYEYDQVYVGIADREPEINSDEVSEWRYITFEELKNEIEEHKDLFTEWFKIVYEKINDYYVKNIMS